MEGTLVRTFLCFVCWWVAGTVSVFSEEKAATWEAKTVYTIPLDNGMTQVSVVAQKEKTKITLWLALFQVPRFELLVIDNGSTAKPRYRGLSHALETWNCVAGSNGGFFEPGGKPNGFLVWDSHPVGSYDSKHWGGGVIVVRDQQLSLESAASFVPDNKVTQLIQTGPWLVEEGRAKEISGDHSTRRTFIANDGGNGWILGYAQYCTLEELAQILASPSFNAGYPVKHALNLDGGPSSGLWIQNEMDHDLYVRETWTVGNFVGIRLKK